MNGDATQQVRTHIMQELGFAIERSGDALRGSASVVPEMCVPGTQCLRTSILATWTDILAGLLAVDVMTPRVPVTLELDVHLYGPPPGAGRITGVGQVTKAGRSVFVGSVDFADEDGAPVAHGGASFMTAPDPSLRLPPNTSVGAPLQAGRRLTMPLAQRAGCERREPGVAVLPRSDDGLNSSKTVNGGLIALVAEEAILSLAPGATLASLAMRYLQPVRTGPAIATARLTEDLARAEVRDQGSEDRLAVVAVGRIAAP